MHKTRHHNHSNVDLSDDIAKIKAALLNTSFDLRERAGEIFNDSVDSVKSRSAKLTDDVTTYATEQPIKSLGIALVAGIFIGAWLRRK